MPSTLPKNPVGQSPPKDLVLSVRLAPDLVAQLDELALEMERSRANLLARAVREYVEREYASLAAMREGERELAAGRGVPHEQVSAWVDDLIAGKGRPDALK
jgi:predicted transcriptional regulator